MEFDSVVEYLIAFSCTVDWESSYRRDAKTMTKIPKPLRKRAVRTRLPMELSAPQYPLYVATPGASSS